MLDQVERRGVCPVQVFEQHAQSTQRRQLGKHGLDRPEQALLGPHALRNKRSRSPDLGKQDRQGVADVRRGVGQRLVEPLPVVELMDLAQHGGDREQRQLCRQRQAGTPRDEALSGGARDVDQVGLADACLAGHDHQPDTSLEVAAHDSQFRLASGDPQRVRAGRFITLAVDGQPQTVELRNVPVHGLDDQFEHAPGRQPGGGEHRRDGGVAAASFRSQSPQAGPPGLVVQAVQGVDEVPPRSGRHLWSRQRWHP